MKLLHELESGECQTPVVHLHPKMGEAMDADERAQLWEQAADTDPHTRYEALTALARGYCQDDDTEQELVVAAAAADAAKLTQDAHLIARATDLHAQVMWEAEQHFEAAAQIVDAAKMYEALGEWYDAGESWFRAAIILLEAETTEGVLTYVDQGNDNYAKTDAYERRSGGLLVIANKLGNLGDIDNATVLSLHARQLGIDNNDPGTVLHASCHLMHSLTRYERHDQAHDLLMNCLADARAQGRFYDIAQLADVGVRGLIIAGAELAALDLITEVINETTGHIDTDTLADLMLLQRRISTNARR